MASTPDDDGICLVAILKDEDAFLDEWLSYHRLIGIDHFVLYDNDSKHPLRQALKRHDEYITLIDWPGQGHDGPGRNTQTKAYEDSLGRVGHKWITFIDGDEFIVLRNHATLKDFMGEFEDAGAVALTWHVFGHNGYFENPTDLVTASLTRRKATPGNQSKSINRREAIASIRSAHTCRLKPGFSILDANKRLYSKALYPGKTDIAHINHYACRSFQCWMSRLERGDTAYNRDDCPADKRWRFDEDGCLRRFVKISRDTNELVDEYMLKYSDQIRSYLATLRTR